MFHKVRSLKRDFLDTVFPSFPFGKHHFASLPSCWSWQGLCCAQSCPTLCDPMDCSPPGSSVHGVSQARILEWVAISFSRGSSWFRDQTCVSCIADRLFTTEPMGQPQGYKSGTNKEKSLLRQTARNECPGELTDLPNLKGQMGSRQTLRQQAVWVSGGQLWC